MKAKDRRHDGQTTFGKLWPGAKFILLRGDRIVREKLRTTELAVYVKLQDPALWTKKSKAASAGHPNALYIRDGVPAHIPEDHEVQVLLY